MKTRSTKRKEEKRKKDSLTFEIVLFSALTAKLITATRATKSIDLFRFFFVILDELITLRN